MNGVRKECVSGFGHTSSLWFQFKKDQMISFVIETPAGTEEFEPDKWFHQLVLILKMHWTCLPKSTEVFPYLSLIAGDRAVRAIRDYDIMSLAIAFTSHYGWQLVNGAKILPAYGELAKVYAGSYAVYLFRTELDKKSALKQLEAA